MQYSRNDPRVHLNTLENIQLTQIQTRIEQIKKLIKSKPSKRTQKF